jgi:hypothetical protein
METILPVAFAIAGLLVYVLPTIVAITRRHPDVWEIGLLNILAGFIGIGWIIALVWACRTTSKKKRRQLAPAGDEDDNPFAGFKG